MSKFLKVIVNLFLVCAILIAGALLVPPLLGVSTTMVDSSSMDTNLPIGSVTYSQEVSAADISAGDKILVESDTMAYAYIVESADAGDGNYIVTDINDPQSEPEEVVLRNVALQIMVTIPLIGYVMIAMRSVEGLIIIGLVVLFVIILFILSELWKKTEDDEDDEDEDEDEDEDTVPELEPSDVHTSDTEVVKEDKAVQPAYADPITELTMDELARSVAELQGMNAQEKSADQLAEEQAEETNVPGTEEPEPVALEEPEDDDRNSFVPVKRPSKEEILRKAERAGEEPRVVEYDNIGVTIVDYSDLI